MRKRNLNRHRWLNVVLAATAALAASKLALAADYTFIAPGGSFSNAGSWLEGISPAGDAGANLFFGSGNYVANQDIGDFSINSINISNDSAGNTVSFTGFSEIKLTGPTAGFYVTGGSVDTNEINLRTIGNVTISNSGSGRLNFGSMILGDGVISVINSGSGTIQLPDSSTTPWYVSGTNVSLDLYNTGTGQLLLGNNALTAAIPNSGFSGKINVKAGVVKLSNPGGDVFGNNTILNVAAGATFDANNNGEDFGGLEGDGLVLLGSGGMNFLNNGNRSFGGRFEGSGGVNHRNNQTLTFTGQINPTFNVTNPQTGEVIGTTFYYSGTVTLSNGGTFSLVVPNAFANTPLIVANGNLFLGGHDQEFAGLAGGSDNGFLKVDGTLKLTGGEGTRLWGTPIIGPGNVIIDTAGVQALLGDSTYTGTTSVNRGRLVASYAGLVNSSSVTVASGAALTVVIPTATDWAIPTINSGGFTKDGAGTLTFKNSALAMNLQSFGIDRGAVVIDRSVDNGEFLGTSPKLSLGTATLQLNGNNSASTVQNFGGTTLAGGAKINLQSGTGQNAVLALGALSRMPGRGGSLNVTTTPNGGGTAAVTTTTANVGAGIMGGWAIVNGRDWAVSGTGAGTFTITPLPSASYTNDTWAANAHTNITANLTTVSNGATGTVRFSTPSALTLRANGRATVTYGGILVTPEVGANAVAITNNAAGSFIVAPANTDLVINQYNTAGELTIGATIANVAGSAITKTSTLVNTANSQIVTVDSTEGIAIGSRVTGSMFSSTANAHVVGIESPTQIRIAYAAITNVPSGSTTLTITPQSNVVKNGPGTLVLTGSNTFKGVLVLNEGTVRMGVPLTVGDNTTSGSSSMYINGGRLEATANYAPGSGIQHWTVGPAGGELYVGSGLTVTKQGNTLFGTGDLRKTGPGTFSVGNNLSYFSGNVIVEEGTLRLTSNQLRLASGITIFDGAQFRLTDTTSGPFQVGPGGVLKIGGAGPDGTGAWYHELDEAGSAAYNFNSPVVLTSTARFVTLNRLDSADTNTDIFPLPISGAGSLIKAGTGSMILSSAFNSYGGTSGSTIISQGRLVSGVNNALPTKTTLQFGEVGSSNSGTFEMNGNSQMVSGLVAFGSGIDHKIINSSTNAATPVLTVNYNGTIPQQFTGRVGGSGSESNIAFVKTGTGSFALLGQTTYTGSATVEQGELVVTDSNTSRAYIAKDGTTLRVRNATGSTLSATALTIGTSGSTNLAFDFLSGIPSPAIQVAENGLTLNGNITLSITSQTQALRPGTLQLVKYGGSIQGAGFSALNPAVILPARVVGSLVNNSANGSIDLQITSADFIRWQGSVNGNWDIGTTANFALASTSAAVTYINAPSADSVVFDDSATGSRNINLTAVLSPSSLEVSTAGTYTFSGSGKISGSTGLAKSGSGKLVLLTDNDYTGRTAVTGGELAVGNGGTSGSLGTGDLSNNAVLSFHRSDDVTVAANISGSGQIIKKGTNTLTLAGALDVSGPITVEGGALSLSAGVIRGDITGAGTLIKSGVGTLTVTGQINTASPTKITGGSLQLGDGGSSGALNTDAAVSGGAFLTFNRGDLVTQAYGVSGDGGIQVLQGNVKLTGSLSYTGQTIINSSTLEFGSNSDTTLYSPLRGFENSVVIKSGSGKLTLLSNNNPFAGDLIVNGGIVQLSDLGAGGDLGAKSITINNGGKFIFGTGGVLSENPDIAGETILTINQGGTFETFVGEDIGRTRLAGGTILLSASLNNTGTTGEFNGIRVESGTIIGSNSPTFGTSTASVNAGAAFQKVTSDAVTITGGVAIASTLPMYIDEGTLSMDVTSVNRSTGTAELRLGHGVLFRITDTGSATNTRPINLNGQDVTVEVTELAGTATFSGNVSGGSNINKTGAGSLVLAGTLNYSGNTTVSGGTFTARTPLRTPDRSLSVQNNGRALLDATSSASAYTVAGEFNHLNVSNGAMVQVTPRTDGQRAKVLVANTITLEGSLDLTSNDMLLRSRTETEVRSWVASWWNDGARNGKGLMSSLSGTGPGLNELATLAVVSNNNNGAPLFATFDGVSASTSDVLVKYTFLGDTDLSGSVDASDLQNLITGLRGNLTGWRNGDNNYDGTVDGDDLANLLRVMRLAGTATFGSSADANNPSSSGGVVPEPSAALTVLAALPLLTRRRRK